MLIVRRALATAGYATDPGGASQCVIATMTLEIEAADHFDIMLGSVTVSAAGAPEVGVPIAIAAAFFSSQAYAWASTCNDTYVAAQEAALPIHYNFKANSAFIRHRAISVSPMAFVG